MITLKELINRKYNEDKQCVGFEYELTVENEMGQPVKQSVYFTRKDELDVKCWEVSMISKNHNINELKAYSIEYMVPVQNMKLETIAATGLRHLQYNIQQEIQYKSIIDFSIGNMIFDM